MIPSDHFVKFYAEVFKYLQKQGQGAMDEYYSTIAEHQKTHCLELFRIKGLAGMKEYWDHIIFEENCDADAFMSEDGKCYSFYMNGCPSLGKVLDNDAGVCDIYCLHCPGWVLPVVGEAGFYCVYDMVRKDIPRCIMKIFADRADAEKYLAVVKKRHPENSPMIACNF